MQKFETSSGLSAFLTLQKSKGKNIGFVPTMGSLHEGHLSLIRKSKTQNDLTIVSIYVNPSQFNDKKDFTHYPKNIEQDLMLLKHINCDIVFIPKTEDMYAGGYRPINIELKNLDLILESKKRPGHFAGVIFIVHKLFKIILPDRTYFGEKDYQQLLIIKELAKIYFKELCVVGCATIRDQDGLAMSSRNKKLTTKQLNIAKKIFTLLGSAGNIMKKNGIQKSKIFVKDFFSQDEQITLDYFEILDEESFSLASELKSNKIYRLMIAFEIEKIRLIDNLKLQL